MYSSYPHTVPAEDHKRLPAFLQLLVFVPHLIATEEECTWHKQEERSGEGKVEVTQSGREFLTPACGYSKSMSLILPGTYSVGVPQISSLSQEEQRAIRQLSGTASTQTLTFFRLYHQGQCLIWKGRRQKRQDAFYKFHWTSTLYATVEIGFLGCRFQSVFGLFLPSKQSHYCGNQQTFRTSQESVTPVQSFAALFSFI